MSRDRITRSVEQQAHQTAPSNRPQITGVHLLLPVAAAIFALLLFTLLYQLPVTHRVDIGGYDAAYTQGFRDPLLASAPELQGSDGSARPINANSYLLFPQVGLPAQLTLRLRGPDSATPPELRVLLNSSSELAQFAPGPEWQTVTFTINGGLLKPNDVVIELRSIAESGILLESAEFSTSGWPITPYPSQLAYAIVAAVLCAVLLGWPRVQKTQSAAQALRTTAGPIALAIIGIGIAFVLLYRMALPYPYPLRPLLLICDALLLLAVVLRYGPAIAQRWPRIYELLALGSITTWLIAVLWSARRHVTLSVPGVENDFGVFARRSTRLFGIFQPSGEYPTAVDGVLRADGFYNLGYPFLLWLLRPLYQGNPFLAAQLISALSGVLLLLATWWLARRWLGAAPALLATQIAALSPFVAEYGLYIGTDMLFAAFCTLALAALLQGPNGSVNLDDGSINLRHSSVWLIIAGIAAGFAFLVRHPGIVLLPIGWLALAWQARSSHNRTAWRKPIIIFSATFLLASSPQLIINLRDTGQLLFNQQAKNIWLCVYGNCDWSRWNEVPNTISLREVVLHDPGRFANNWLTNLRGFVGTGAEDTSEFGRAIHLRLLGFPANWLALAGLLGWLWLLVRNLLGTGNLNTHNSPWRIGTLLCWLLLYTLGVTVGILLPRFFLPLVPVYAIAAAWLMMRITAQLSHPAAQSVTRQRLLRNAPLLITIVLLFCLRNGFRIGSNYVLQNQPPSEIAAIQLVQSTLQPTDRLIVQLPARSTLGQYSAIAHYVVNDHGDYLLSADAQPPANATVVGTAGSFTLYRLNV